MIQTGVAGGGSVLYFAHLLDLIGADPHALVIGVDLTLGADARRHKHNRIRLVEGSSTDPKVLTEVRALAAGRTGMVSLDSDHECTHVSRARGICRLRHAWHAPHC